MREKLAEDVAHFKIFSSTDIALATLEALGEIFEEATTLEEALSETARFIRRLNAARPTSVMINNLARRILGKVETLVSKGFYVEDLSKELRVEIEKIKDEVESAIRIAATLCARRVREGEVVLTCSYSRSILEVFSTLIREKRKFAVIVTESRPGGEGIFFAEQLGRLGVDVTLIVDSAVRYFMKDVDKVIVGADAIAANGAVVNKVGTSLIALAAHEARVRTFVVATTHKFSHETILGELVKIPFIRETLRIGEDTTLVSPAFDVTPPEYIDAIITERGMVAPEAVILLVREMYGWPPRARDIDDIVKNLLKAS